MAGIVGLIVLLSAVMGVVTEVFLSLDPPRRV